MSVRRSIENLAAVPPAPSSSNQVPPSQPGPYICEICKNCITVKAHAFKSNCNHNFHKSCFNKYTQNKTNCPTCNSQISVPKVSNQKTPPNLNVTTRNQARQQQADENRSASGAHLKPTTPNTSHSSNTSPESAEQQRRYIRNLVTAAVGAQQAEMLSSLSEQLTQLIQTNFEAAFNRLNINSNPNSVPRNVQIDNNAPNEQNDTDQDNQSLNRILGLPQPDNQDNFINFDANPPINLIRGNSGISVDLSMRPDKISQIISNWRLKFSGNSTTLSVDSFLYRIEALTNQTLGGNFELLCRNASALFEGKASDWYWRYHKTVREIKWQELCASLRRQFRDTRTDMDYRELIRDRKQKPGESFDAFYDSILELVDHLNQPIAEPLMIEILRRNILPEIQHEILNLQIFSVDHLRDICRRREFFLQDIKTRIVSHRPLAFSRKVAELYEENEDVANVVLESKNDISELSLICWNCKKTGHRYQDCFDERNVFCYGCGASNVYKPTCQKCNPPKNFQSSAHPSARKPMQMKKTDRSTSTD